VTALLEVNDLHVSYGKIAAVKGITFHVDEGEVVTLVGSNGAGKTTTLRALSGLHRPASGEITFAGERIDATPAHEIVSIGLGHSPEGRHVFVRMTIEENLLLGAFLRRKANRGELQADVDRVYSMFPVLGDRRQQTAGTLSGGEQQMLAMGRALMNKPRLLMLDEPSMGLSPIMMKLIMDTVAELRNDGTTVLLVEQNALAALKLADRGYVLEGGKIVLEDTGANLLVNEDVQKAYLGQD
jgi:branched-chain amino acid transport system ATP-binding protein